MQDGKLTYEELERDLGRYKKKVQDDYKQILKLEAELEAWKDINRSYEALIAAILQIFKAEGKENGVFVAREKQNEMLRDYYVGHYITDQQDGSVLWLQKKAGE